MPRSSFEKLVKKKESANSLGYLNSKKLKHSKVLHIKHSELKMQDYIQPNSMSIQEVKFAFSLRSRMVDIRGNFENKYSDILCPVCKKEEDRQPHLLVCEGLCDTNTIVSNLPSYDSLFGADLKEMATITRIIRSNFQKRKEKLKPS